MQFPDCDYRSTSHARLTPNDRPHVDDGLVSTAWNAGTLHIQYVGFTPISDSAVDEVGRTMWRFAADCQIMVVLYSGVLHSQGRIQAQLDGNIDRERLFAVTTDDSDGNVDDRAVVDRRAYAELRIGAEAIARWLAGQETERRSAPAKPRSRAARRRWRRALARKGGRA